MSGRLSSGKSGSRSSPAQNKPSIRGRPPANTTSPVTVKDSSSPNRATSGSQLSKTKEKALAFQSSGDFESKGSAMHKPRRINTSGVKDHQTLGATSRPISKNTSSFTHNSKKSSSTQIKLPGQVPTKDGLSTKTSHDERIVGSSANVTAVFGTKELDDSSILSAVLVKQARQSGQLNLSNRNLSSVPSRVWRINEPDEDEQKQIKKGLSIDRVRSIIWYFLKV